MKRLSNLLRVALLVMVVLLVSIGGTNTFAASTSKGSVTLLLDENCNNYGIKFGHIGMQIVRSNGNTYFFEVSGANSYTNILGGKVNLGFFGKAKVVLNQTTSIGSRSTRKYKIPVSKVDSDLVYSQALSFYKNKDNLWYYTKNMNCATYVYLALLGGGLHTYQMDEKQNLPIDLFFAIKNN